MVIENLEQRNAVENYPKERGVLSKMLFTNQFFLRNLEPRMQEKDYDA